MTLLARNPTSGRYTGMFVGNDQGEWDFWPKILLGRKQYGWTWEAVLGMSSQNQGRNLSVEGATEQHRGFQRAFPQIVAAYPELVEFVIDFDGPKMPVPVVLAKMTGQGQHVDWPLVEFYHGTAGAVAPAILQDGLRPRGAGRAVYGAGVGAVEGRSDAVYLTTQLGTAHFAAREAANALGGSPTVLIIRGLPGKNMAPDMDSQEATAEASLGRLGSVAYVGIIPASHIRRHSEYRDREWVESRGGGKRRHGKKRSVLALAKDVRRQLR